MKNKQIIIYNGLVIGGLCAIILCFVMAYNNNIAIKENREKLMRELEQHQQLRKNLMKKLGEYHDTNKELSEKLDEHQQLVKEKLGENERLIQEYK